MAKERIPEKLKVWIEARKRFHLSHAQIQMARELGLNPKKFGKLANHKQESWKMPLPLFIEHLCRKQFGRERPEAVMSIEDKIRHKRLTKLARTEARRAAAANSTSEAPRGDRGGQIEAVERGCEPDRPKAVQELRSAGERAQADEEGGPVTSGVCARTGGE
jgi:hypothetical protein